MEATSTQPTTVPGSELAARIDRSMADDRARSRRTGVISVDFGTPQPDAVVRVLLARLASIAREGDAVGQISPTGLLLLAPGLREVDALAQLVVRVTAELRGPVEVLGTSYPCSCSVGGAISDARSTVGALVDAATGRATGRSTAA